MYVLSIKKVFIHTQNVEVEKERERSEIWYNEIGKFLESQAGGDDATNPWSLVIALCRVLADAAEQINAPDRKKLEYVIRMTAYSMGFDGIIVVLGKNKDPDSIV